MAWWAVANILILIYRCIKMMNLVRIYPKAGYLIKLLSQVLKDCIHFTWFFLGWVYVFSLIFQAAGISIDDGSFGGKWHDLPNSASGINRVADNAPPKGTDYPYINDLFKYALYTYSNSIGNINPPGYGYWIKNDICNIKNMAESEVYSEKCGQWRFTSQMMIGLVWFLWLFNQFFMLIILLNFLIAVISASYDDVQSTQKVNEYNYKCELNFECMLLENSTIHYARD